MRIAHVVTYRSKDGAFGGPTRVAESQAKALADRGHEVTLFAASPEAECVNEERDGYRILTFPAKQALRRKGFSYTHSPELRAAIRDILPNIEVVHIHIGRDLVTLPVARQFRRANIPYILQPHGMINRTDALLARPIDTWFTRPALNSARRVLALTPEEEFSLSHIAPAAKIDRITNGVSVADIPAHHEAENVVLFLARLHPRKRPREFVEMALQLTARFPATKFVLAGPDEGEAAAVNAMIQDADASHQIKWIGAIDPVSTDALLASARVFVLPSVNEVFPMTIIESFKAGTPVVTTDSLGIASQCRAHGAAIVTDGTADALAQGVAAVLEDSTKADQLRAGGRRLLIEQMDIRNVVDQLEKIYGGEPA